MLIPLTAQSRSASDFTIGLSYYGELLTHPGFKIFADYSFAHFDNSSLDFRLNFGLYNHPEYSHAFFLLPELVYHLESETGLFFEPSIGAGWLIQAPDAYVVSYDESGFSQTTGLRHYFMPSASVRGGVDILLPNTDEIGFAAAFTGFWQYPFNNQWLVHPAVELECRYSFSKKDQN